jgi:hypothetical protein
MITFHQTTFQMQIGIQYFEFIILCDQGAN